MDWEKVDHLIDLALSEDLPSGDLTTEAIVGAAVPAEAVLLAKQAGILAGVDIAARVFARLEPKIIFKKKMEDGHEFQDGQILAELAGPAASILTAERTALNFLQRLSGIATLTKSFVDEIKGTRARILDTRKTTPGWRQLEKYAVKMGGGHNHRLSLSDMILIKDNHIRIAGGLEAALRKAKEYLQATGRSDLKIEVEAASLDEVREALRIGTADWIMLDNMSLNEIKAAVELVAGRVLLEVSGKVNLRTVKALALTGVDFISVGALTHSFKSADISLEFL
ncbi:MAG: carboxylating nicotinate-nucleotide diphosphorylase [Acidobacteriota bacterium]|nr:carboxylating nicotinate-nucleotide diphosphorylase [Acidobacteriota bacterium]MDW3228552.1 carboxylating nicotinate-nucleotide diphosphorylase [Acidobacteriota bacterium]MDY0230855.1 carboxylating nicotinate-nucleotide diphosphorylase [Candidatus Saccharicenans sp.]